jgi:acetyl esterase
VLHPQAVAAEALWAEGPSVVDPGFDVVAERAAQRTEGLAEVGPAVEVVTDVDADGVACRLYRSSDRAPVVVQLHGGGFVLGDLETHDAHCRRLALASGSAVLSVDYRRAPEHRYPAASDDVDTAVDWLRLHGRSLEVDSGRISVTGDSAGGQLALLAALRRPVFESVALVYPCLDPTGGYPSYRTESGGLSAEEMTWFWDSYLGGDPPAARAAELQPLGADLAVLPPTLVITAEHDPLRDEGEALAVIAAAAGVRCVAARYLGMIHGFYRHPELFDASSAALGQVAAWVGGAART